MRYLLLIALSIAFAQKGWYVGLRVVPQNTWLLNQQDSDAPAEQFSYVFTYGVAAGIGGGYAFSPHLGIKTEILYSSEGQAHSYETLVNGEPLTVVRELRLRYVKLPLMFKISTNTERKYAFYFQAGPQFSYLLSVKEYDNNPAYPHEATLPIDPPGEPDYYNVPNRYDTFNPYVIGAVAQIGLEIKLRFNVKMHAALRVDYGFTDVENKNAKYTVYQNGVAQEVPFYSSYTLPHYKDPRPPTNPLTAGLLIGFSYLFIPQLHY